MDFAEDFPFNEVLEDDIYNLVQENDRPDIDKSEPELIKESQSPRIGLTTKQETLSRCENKVNTDVLISEVFKPDFILNVVSFIILFSCLIYTLVVYKRSEYTNELWEYIVEIIMYLPWIVINLYVKVIIKLNKVNKKVNRIREIINFLYINGGTSVVEMEYKGYSMDPPSSDFVSVYRDLDWVRLPRNVLVKGDIFKLHLNQTFPCDCKLVLNYKDDELILHDEIYKEGSKCLFLGPNTENEKFIDGTFLALNDSFTSYLDSFIAIPGFRAAFNTQDSNSNLNNSKKIVSGDSKDASHTHGNTASRNEVIWNYNDNYIFLNNNNKVLIMIILVLTVMLNIFWNIMYDIESKIGVLVNLSRLLILFEFAGFEPVQKLSELWGNVKLFSIFEIYHEQRFIKDLDPVRSVSSSSFLTNSSYDSVSSDLLVDDISFSFQFKQLSRVLQKGLFEEGSLIRQMSCITLLCFIDDIGILLNSNQSLQEMSIITSHRGRVNPRDPADMDVNKGSRNNKDEHFMNKKKVVEKDKDNKDNNRGDKDNKEKESNDNLHKDNKDTVDERKDNLQKDNLENNNVYNRENNRNKVDNKDLNNNLEDDEGEDDDADDDLLILDIFNDINLYGKDNIRFTNEYERSCKSLLKPLVFSMSLTSIPTYIPLYTYPVHDPVNTSATTNEIIRDNRDNSNNLDTQSSENISKSNSNLSKDFRDNLIQNKDNKEKESNDNLHRDNKDNKDFRELSGQSLSLSSSFGHEDTNSFVSDVSVKNKDKIDIANRNLVESLEQEQLEKKRISQQILRGDQILGKNRLYKNYISMLINNELDNFNNCLCTLTNVLGIKKLYLKKYKLLKFVLFNFSNQRNPLDPLNNRKLTKNSSENNLSSTEVFRNTKEILSEMERQYESGDENKILIYFFRDVNKKIIQMLIKCKISIINKYKLNYYNGKKINNLNKRIKRKIKDLNIQWLSNGMNTFLYFYKPISINDFNILLLLLPYITVYNISSSLSLQRDSCGSSSSESSVESGRPTIIRRNENKNVYMCMYKNNRLYYKYKGINILQLSKIYRSQSASIGDDSSRDSSRSDLGKNYEKESSDRQESSRSNICNIDKDTILGSYIGEMLNSYIKNSILLGMVATKYSLPREISNRINDLHEAGIRFVYFSKHNEKVTRIIGGLLGLETSWNSMISLSTSENTSFVNQEGHMVLPNGIDNIRQHIQQVDDIPLQVSLFCNCNYSNINEMLDILNENGENIMCIGSGLNPSNFYLFNNSHLSFSISLNYNPICRFCKGKRWQGISKAHIFEDPKLEFQLSSMITSLTCSLQTTHLYKVSDPDFVFEMLNEMFREARNISTNLQDSSSFMLLSYYSIIWMFFLQNLLSLPPVFTTFDFSLIVFLYIPYLSMTLLSNPIMDRIMLHLPNKVKRKNKITYTNFLRTYLRIFVMSSFVVVVYYTHIYFTNMYISNKFGLGIKGCKNYFFYPRLNCVNKVIEFLKKETDAYDPHVCLILSQNFTSISFVLFLIITSLSWIQKYSYINLETFTNINWIAAVVVILTLHVSIVIIKLILLNLKDSLLMKKMIINTSYSLLLTIPILIFDQVMKIFTIKDKNRRQKFLQLLFSTRLGTWSPK